MSATVSIITGSESDLELAKKCGEILESFSIDYSINIFSAHRTPELLKNHLNETEKEGTKIYIAIAGLAAHLAGAIAAKTTKPVIGVPADNGPLEGIDALLSTVQMPKGVPVATMSVGKSGAINAAILTAEIISLHNSSLVEKLQEFKNAGSIL